MNTLRNALLVGTVFTFLGLAPVFGQAGGSSTNAPTVVNDGSSTQGLLLLTNLNGGGSASVALTSQTLGTNAVLQAAQSDYVDFLPLRAVWYANQYTTGADYTVSADYLPATNSFEHVGGVMGWLDPASGTGITLQVAPSQPAAFQVNTVNFNAGGDANESATNLYMLDGTPASKAIGSAWGNVGDYNPTNFATFQLEFSTPTAADLGVMSNVTAHIKAQVFQTGTNQQPVQVGDTIELLTDLPVPAQQHFGYFGYWSDIFSGNDVIGYFDNLTVNGYLSEAPPPPSGTPVLTITYDGDKVKVTWPAEYTTYQLQSSTNLANPIWTNVTLTGVNTAEVPIGPTPLYFRLVGSGGPPPPSAPVLTVESLGNALKISWPAGLSGYQLEMSTNLVSTNWTSVTTTGHSYTNDLSGPSAFFRLSKP